jgi:O-6-methylguanine DNA methyltransferase
MSQYFTLFATPIGPCAIAWNDIGVVGVNLPEADAVALRKRMRSRFPQVEETAPSPKIKRIIMQINSLLDGKSVDLSDTPLDMSGLPAFHQRVYELVSKIPAGQTLSYGEVAKHLKKPGAARAVGQAMGRNPFPIIVPCHRVLAASGKLGGFTSFGGTDTKQRMLQIEGTAPQQAIKPTAKAKQKIATSAYSFNVSKALKHLRKADPQLAELIDVVGPFRMTVDQTQDVFLALAEAIVYQQLHGKAAATIFKRVCELFPKSGEFFVAKDIVRCTDEKLRGAGLSQNKLLALRDLSNKMVAGELPDIHALHELDSEFIIERLSAVRGIGRWTVEMLLIFRLGRPDVLPVDDFGVRKGFMLAFKRKEMPTPKELKAYGERWAPYRSVASWYLWRAADQTKAAK